MSKNLGTMTSPAMRSPARRPRGVHRIAAWLLILSMAGGCTSLRQWLRNGFKVGPNYAPPPAPAAANWIDKSDARVNSQTTSDYLWWTVFQDATLNNLIETAYRQNLDLKTAGTRILTARAQRNVAIGNLFPQTQTATAAYAHAQLSRNLAILPNLPGAGGEISLWADGFNASWEADVWGRYRRTIEQANANMDASFEAYGDTLVMMLAEVATSYVQLRTFQQRLEYATRNVEIQRGSLGIAAARFRDGVASELDVTQAASNMAQTEALIPQLRAGLRQSNNALCVLLGIPPENLVTQFARAPIPRAPVTVAVGIPADLLRRRPDVRRAERQVAAQSAAIGIAESDWYPRFSVNGFIGYTANDLNDLFAAKSFTGFVLPTAQWNILNYGRILNNVRAQNAQLETTTLQYQQTVLNAGREVENALVQFLEAQQQAIFLAESVKQAERSVELVTLQFRGGVTDFNRVYTTQATLVTQQDQLASTQGNIAQQLIAVYRALGGGWEYFRTGEGMPACLQGGTLTEHRKEEVQRLPEAVPAPPAK